MKLKASLSVVIILLLITLVLSINSPIYAIDESVVKIDGNLSETELKNTKEQEMAGGGKVFYKTVGSQLYVAVRGIKPGMSHICLTDGENVYILHASGALGTAIYKKKEERWQLTQKFTWELRDGSMNPKAIAARKAFYKKNGWLANVGGMGKSNEMEYIISSKYIHGKKYKFAFLYAISPDSIQHYPKSLTDDSYSLGLISGKMPTILNFEIDTWSKVSSSSIKYNIPKGKHVLVDGKCVGEEWKDSREIAIGKDYKLKYKKTKDFAYFCVKPPKEQFFSAELYLSPEDKKAYTFHVSAKLGEREMKSGNWEKFTQESNWWETNGWTANALRPKDFEKSKFLPSKSIEFQISRKHFRGENWKLMLSISGGRLVFPKNGDALKVNTWAEFIL